MQIKQVVIENFKQFRLLEVGLGSLVCLVGPNNSGKTSLLQALALFDFCLHLCLNRRNGGNGGKSAWEFKNRSIGSDEMFVLPLANPLDLWTDRIAMKAQKQQIVQVRVAFDEGPSVTCEVKLSYNRLALSVSSSDTRAEWLEKLATFEISYLPVFSSFLALEERRTLVAVREELIRGRVSAVIRNLLFELRENGREALQALMQRAFPELTELGIQFDEANDRYISVTYRERNRPKEFDLFSAGSGFQQFVYLFGFILLKSPQVILLDEPDVHLHGTLQETLLNELRRLVGEGKQVLFATHSHDLLAKIEPEKVLFLEGGSAQPLAVSFDIFDMLDSLGSLDPTELPIVQAYRRVVVVEDRTDQELISIFCSKVLGPATWQRVRRRIVFCHTKGNPVKQQVDLLREQLQQMLVPGGGALKMLAVADRDYHPDIVWLLEQKRREHLSWHIWHRTEIENYLLSVSTLTRLVYDPMTPLLMPTLEALQREFDRLVEASRDAANDQLVKAFYEYGRSRGQTWDPTTCSRKAREYLTQQWDSEKIALADAKEVVLPGLKRLLQGAPYCQHVSDRALAESIMVEELPDEIRQFSRMLAEFAEIPLE